MKKLPQKSRTARLQVVAQRGTSWLLNEGDAVLLAITVVCNATRNRVMGIHDGLLKVQLATPPAHDRCNATLVAFIAQRLSIPKAQIALTAGGTSARKRLRISQVPYQAVLLALSPSEG